MQVKLSGKKRGYKKHNFMYPWGGRYIHILSL